MAKKKSAKKKARAKPARSVMRAATPHPDDHVDGCDVAINESNATPDSELPEARGGVEVVRAKSRR